MYGGQHTTLQPSFELGGSKDKLDYFFSGQYLQSQLGVEPPTPGPSAYHDQTYQGQAFSYLSYFLNPTTRLSLISGFALNHFQIPDNPNQPQVFQLAGVPFYPSVNINENQLEQNYLRRPVTCREQSAPSSTISCRHSAAIRRCRFTRTR